MGSEVRPPLTVEETGPQFNHCHISDIWKNVSGSGVWVGWGGSRFGQTDEPEDPPEKGKEEPKNDPKDSLNKVKAEESKRGFTMRFPLN